MTRPNEALLAVAVIYPAACFAVLWPASGPSRIPTVELWAVFAFVLPALCAAGAIGAKLSGARLGWVAVGGFVVWVALVGYAYHCFITGIWAVI